jgi:hypothetical protein
MRRLLAVFVGIALGTLPSSAFAQDIASGARTAPPAEGFAIAVKGAPTVASLNQGINHWKGGKGALAGASFAGWANRRVSLVGEGLFARRHASNLGDTASLNMIELPVLANVQVLPSRSRMGVYAVGGHSLDVNLRTSEQKAGGINLVDSNLVVGAGVTFGRFGVEARENIGLRDLAANTPGLKSRAFSVIFGYRIR